jgi:hypothetical protein
MAEDEPGRVVHGLSVAVATLTGAVLGFSAVALVAVLVLAALDATIGVEPPDVAEVPDTAGEWALAMGAFLGVVAGGLIGSRHPVERRPTDAG